MNPQIFIILLLPLISLVITGCYSVRRSGGGAQTSFFGQRMIQPGDVAVPEGFIVEIVATNLNFPTGVAFGEDGDIYLTESGYAYGEIWTTPRLLRIDKQGNKSVVVNGGQNGPWNGVQFHDGNLFVAEGGVLEGGRILKISDSGNITVLASNLPSFGDHHTDGPVVGPDGQIYFGQGTASNSGIVGEDNAKLGWLHRHPRFHDIPGEDITLSGLNVKTRDVRSGRGGPNFRTGAFMPFGTSAQSGQVIQGEVPCNGAIMAVPIEGGPLKLVAWGFRNPYGLAFSPEGKLFVTDQGYDDRGSRPVGGASDLLWEVKKGMWYGWPDFSGERPLTDPNFKPPGKSQPRFLLAKHPNQPPRPAAFLGVHAAAGGMDFSRNVRFGYPGEAFIALFGDQAPATGKLRHPSGFKVVRVEVSTGVIHDFMVNRGPRKGPASKLKRHGLERPIAVRFDPSGEFLYVVDFGVLTQSTREATPHQGTGVLWRISKSRNP